MFRSQWVLVVVTFNSLNGCKESTTVFEEDLEWQSLTIAETEQPPGYTVLNQIPELSLAALDVLPGDDIVSLSEAQQTVRNAYPDYDFGEDIMSGPEQIGDIWIDAYMMSATVDFDVLEVVVDAHTGEIVKEVILENFAAPRANPCAVGGVLFGAWWSQNDPTWAPTLLGNSSTDTLGGYGCVISSLAMAYNDVWGVPTNPANLNSSAISSGCFGAGSSLVTVSCAINSRGGPHSVTDLSITAVATAICGGYPVMVDVSWGGGHKMLTYRYTGGSTSSLSSYLVVDPWDGTSKSVSGFTATRWRKLF